MKKLLLISAAVIVCGLIVFIAALCSVGFDISKLNVGGEPVKHEKIITCEDIDSFEFSAYIGNVIIGTSPDSDAHLTYYDNDYEVFELKTDNGKLSLKSGNARTKWYQYLQFGLFDKSEAVVLLPKKFKGTITVTNTTGRVKMDSLQKPSDISVTVTTGKIILSEIACDNLSLVSTTGNAELNNVDAKGSVTADSTTGKIIASSVSGKTVSFNSTTGNIEFSSLSADEIDLNATTGKLSGSISGNQTDFTIASDTSTGRNSLPEKQVGGKKQLSADTSTGNIDITFTKD